MNDKNDNSIDILEITSTLLKNKFLIIGMTFLFSVFSVYYALSIPNTYTSSSQLSINDQDSKASSMLNQYSGLASIAGISMPQSSADSKAYRAIATINSNDFFKVLIDSDPTILPSIMAAKSYDVETKKLLFDDESYDVDKSSWVRKPTKLYSSEPSYIEAHEYYLGLFDTEFEQVTRYINISVNHVSPIFAHHLLNLMIETANEIARSSDLEDAENSLDFLKEEDLKISIISINKSISGLIDQQLKTKMLAKISNDYLLRKLDSPFIPIRKSAPNRPVICIFGFILGFFGSCFFVILRFFLASLKQ